MSKPPIFLNEDERRALEDLSTSRDEVSTRAKIILEFSDTGQIAMVMYVCSSLEVPRCHKGKGKGVAAMNWQFAREFIA